jgi:uncharacterized protein (UPF0216 family)
MDYHELQKTTVNKLREMAKQYEDLEGVTGMSKERLVDALAAKLGIERPHKVVIGIDKASIKVKMRALKKERDAALAAKDRARLHAIRHDLHKLRHRLRKATQITA